MELRTEYFIEHCDEIGCECHVNAELEVVFVEEGSVSVMCERKTEVLRVGEAMLIFPYTVHGFSPGIGARARVFMFSLSIANDFYDTYKVKNYDSYRFRPDARLMDFIDYARDKYREKKDIFIVKSLFYALTSEFVSYNTAQARENAIGTDVTRRTMEYIYDRLSEPLTLSQVSAALGINKTALTHIFEDYIGVSLKQLLNNMRMEKALILLEETSLTITQIAFECGFGSLRTFNRIFAARMNCSPTDYRKTWNVMNLQNM
ncbi:MAG: helix-turn-helix transcriptional regulator [Clostridia bacterium]|nr:helix-turn-helix transcriptional regulator [Clostridia bacterium]